MSRVKVDLGKRSYTIHIGSDLLRSRQSNLREWAEGRRVFVLFDSQLYALHGRTIEGDLRRAQTKYTSIVVPSGERSKSRGNVSRLQDFLLAEGVSRNDRIVACGGGVVSDLAGYVAATTLRGVSWGVISTTLLGQVDAAIGGKTGVNTSRGKNLVGAFWQPDFVLCDLEYLPTLSPRHLVAGLGEVLKYAALTGPRMIERLERYLRRGDLLHNADLGWLVTRSARYKADIVSRDEREGHLRMVLNLGHTFGHAIETSLGYRRLLHGEAVTLGVLAACELSRDYGMKEMNGLAEVEAVAHRLVSRLPRRRLDMRSLTAAMMLDKKRQSGRLRFVLLDKPGKPFIADDVSAAAVKRTWRHMIATYDELGGTDAPRSGR